jgi:hypothetical protein
VFAHAVVSSVIHRVARCRGEALLGMAADYGAGTITLFLQGALCDGANPVKLVRCCFCSLYLCVPQSLLCRMRKNFLPFSSGARNAIYLQRSSKALPTTDVLDRKEDEFIAGRRSPLALPVRAPRKRKESLSGACNCKHVLVTRSKQPCVGQTCAVEQCKNHPVVPHIALADVHAAALTILSVCLPCAQMCTRCWLRLTTPC